MTTRSGQGSTTPHGQVTASYGSFGTSNAGFNLSYGGKNWGNFVSANGLNTGRFLDPPEFSVMHAKGNEENFFDRVDYQFSTANSVHFNVGYTRSWFQTPNSFDSQFASPWHGVVVDNSGLGPNGVPVGPADQRAQIKTFNIAPSWTRLLSSSAVFTVGGFVRRDRFDYYPSANPFADLGPTNLQRETVSQDRTLTNAGLRADVSVVKGVHDFKAGAVYQQTFLDENDRLGIVDPTLNAPCLDNNGNPVEGFNDPSQCAAAGLQPNVTANPNATTPFDPMLACYDLTRATPSPANGCANSASTLFGFHGHTDIKELALYARDNITKGNWSFNLGVRGDFYNGLTTHREGEPRLGIAYHIKASNTVLRVSYARVLETPFNENLVLSSNACTDPVLSSLLGCFAPGQATPLSPGWRNEFHAGIEQAFSRYVVFSAEYIWKYTHNGYDFSILGNTPVTFPVEWQRSKIPGLAGRLSVANFHGFTALAVFSSVAARFFTPQIGGAGAVPSVALASGPSTPFRIDHDEKFNLTTHFQYQPWERGPWFGFNWRYDSGLVAGQTPCFGGNCAQTTTLNGHPVVALTDSFGTPLTADQEFEAGLFCGSQRATATVALPNPCPLSQYGSTLLNVPRPNTEDDDKNPPRIAARNLFDLAVGDDNLFHGDRYRWSVQVSVINLTNRVALYNFLSTFSGTHYVTPRAITGQIGFNF